MKHVVLLTVDSVRRDAINKSTFENSLNILETDFAYFSNTVAQGVATPFAFPSIISGRLPTRDGEIPSSATTLAEGIPGKSFAFVNNLHLHNGRGYRRGFDSFCGLSTKGSTDDSLFKSLAKKSDLIRSSSIASNIYQRLKSIKTSPLPNPYHAADVVTSNLKERMKNSTPEFIWGHWMDPHTPYHPKTALGVRNNIPDLATLKEIDDRFTTSDVNNVNGKELDVLKHLYNASIRFFDFHLTSLLDWMSSQEWYNDSIIIILSDHGEYFGEHGLTHHPWDTDPHDEIIEVPLWIKYPGQVDGGKKFEHLVGQRDIIATINSIIPETSLKIPTSSFPLRNSTERSLITVSNTAKRITESSGIYFERRDGEIKEIGEISEEGKQQSEDIEFPTCTTMGSGVAVGVADAERKKNLRQLGYR